MKWLVVVLSVILLAACSMPDPNLIKPVDSSGLISLSDGKSAVIVGISIPYSRRSGLLNFAQDAIIGGWIAIDPRTGDRVGKAMLDIPYSNKQAEGTDYRLYVLTAGTYTLGWFQNTGVGLFLPTQFRSISTVHQGTRHARTFSEVAHASPNSPSFTVGAGEVVYAGDLIMEFNHDTKQVVWSAKQSDDDVRKFLAKSGLAGQFVTRVLKRADGEPFGRREGIQAEQ